jgi:glycosyl-4,4'-diaponeurosporenoate acyltransferase
MSASAYLAVLKCALGWLSWSLLVGALANRVPPSWLAAGHWFWRLSRQGRRQGFERRLAIRRWKAWLPDAGNALPKGVAKAALVGRDRADLERLVLETKRAELVHLLLLPFWIVTSRWLTPAGVLLNLLFACGFNLPCIWIQRYNRLRLISLLERSP